MKTIKDRFGNEHKIQCAMIKDWRKWVDLVEQINPINVASNMMLKKEDGSYDEEPYNALIEILKMALRKDKGEYTTAEIEEFIDVDIAREVVQHFMGME